MENSEAKFPDLKWAQRKDRLYVTIDLPDVESPNIDLKPEGKLKFSGKVKDTKYAIDLDLFNDVIVEDSKWNLKGRLILLNIIKKDQEAEYWPRLTKEKMKHPHIKIDWDKWIEEEDENAEPNADMMGDWDPSNMQNFGMGDYEDSDDDEEEEVQEPEEAKADLGDLDDEEEAETAPKTQDASTGDAQPASTN